MSIENNLKKIGIIESEEDLHSVCPDCGGIMDLCFISPSTSQFENKKLKLGESISSAKVQWTPIPEFLFPIVNLLAKAPMTGKVCPRGSNKYYTCEEYVDAYLEDCGVKNLPVKERKEYENLARYHFSSMLKNKRNNEPVSVQIRGFLYYRCDECFKRTGEFKIIPYFRYNYSELKSFAENFVVWMESNGLSVFEKMYPSKSLFLYSLYDLAKEILKRLK